MAKELKVKAVITAQDKMTGPISRMVGRSRAKLKSLSSALKPIGLGIAAAGAAAAGIGYGIHRFAKAYSDLGSKLHDTSKATGVSTEALSELDFAARQAGMDAGGMARGIGFFAKTMGQAEAKTGALYTLLGKVAPDLQAQLLATEGMETRLYVAFRALARVEDPARKAALAAAFFGRSAGSQMLPVLADGVKGVDALRKEAKRLGISMSGEAAAAADKYGDSLTSLSASVQGLKIKIGERLLPVLNPLVDRLTAWSVANRDVIATKIGEYVERLGRWLEGVNWGAVERGVAGVAAGMLKLAEALEWIASNAETVKGLAKVAGGAWVGFKMGGPEGALAGAAVGAASNIVSGLDEAASPNMAAGWERFRAMNLAPAAALAPMTAPAQRAEVTVRVEAAPGTTAEVTATKSRDPDLSVKANVGLRGVAQ